MNEESVIPIGTGPPPPDPPRKPPPRSLRVFSGARGPSRLVCRGGRKLVRRGRRVVYTPLGIFVPGTKHIADAKRSHYFSALWRARP